METAGKMRIILQDLWSSSRHKWEWVWMLRRLWLKWWRTTGNNYIACSMVLSITYSVALSVQLWARWLRQKSITWFNSSLRLKYVYMYVVTFFSVFKTSLPLSFTLFFSLYSSAFLIQDPRFMDFLGNLCVCEGRAIPSTQSKPLLRQCHLSIIISLVLQTPSYTSWCMRMVRYIVHTCCTADSDTHYTLLSLSQKVFYLTAVGGSSQYPSGRRDEVYVRSPGGTEWKLLTEVVQKVPLCYPYLIVYVLLTLCGGGQDFTTNGSMGLAD